MDSVVACVGGVGVYYPKEMKVGPEERLLGGDVEGEDTIHPLEPWEHRVQRKKRYVNIGRHTGLPNTGEK